MPPMSKPERVGADGSCRARRGFYNSAMRTPSMVLATVFAALTLATGCHKEADQKMVSFGPGVQADLVIYFKPGVTEPDITKFWEDVLSKPPTPRGRDLRDGVSGIVRLPAKNGRE